MSENSFKPLSREWLIQRYLDAEKQREDSPSILLFIGGLALGILGGLVCIRLGIQPDWAEAPGSAIAAVGFLWAFCEKTECEQTCDDMRALAELTPQEFYAIRLILGG